MKGPPKKESWLAVTVEVSSGDADLISHIFHELHCNGIIEDKTKLVAYFDGGNTTRQKLASDIDKDFKKFPSLANTKIEIIEAAHTDWQTNWRQYFRTFEIVPGIFVSPSWEVSNGGKNTITLDPGMAFGTGLHETTRMCAKAVEFVVRLPADGLVAGHASCVVRKKQNFLDIGTGSGLLALVARKLGIEKITAVENDADAAKVARENLEINREGGIEVFANITDVKGKFDIVVANILLFTLIELKEELISRLADGGKLIMSGVTHDQEENLIRSFVPPLSLETKTRDGEWSLLVFGKGGEKNAAVLHRK